MTSITEKEINKKSPRLEEENRMLQNLLSSSTFTNISFMDDSHAPHVHGPSCNHGHDHDHEEVAVKSAKVAL